MCDHKKRYIVKKPGNPPEIATGELLWMEFEYVLGGGWPEKLPVDGGVSDGNRGILAYCNEGRVALGLPFNYAVAGHRVRCGMERPGEPVFGYKVFGPVVFFASNGSGEPVDMSDEQIKLVLESFVGPHMGLPKGVRL